MDIVINKTYKNAEYEIVVEDDVITAVKVFIDNKCVLDAYDIVLGDGSDIAYTKANSESVEEILKREINEMWWKNFNELAEMRG